MTNLMRLLCVLLVLVSLGCRNDTADQSQDRGQGANEITVSAAVSLRDAFQEIGRLYETRAKRKVVFNFGASGALQKQIEAGAPADVFASAGARQMDELAARNLIEISSRRDFARNALVLIVPRDSQSGITAFAKLPEAERIAIGNPRTVPAGQYTEQLLKNTNLWSQLEVKFILAEDVRQVLDYVARGETDAGIVYQTDVRVAGERVRVVATAEENSHNPILYPIAVIKESSQKSAAQEFVNLVTSAEGQSILARQGFAGVGGR